MNYKVILLFLLLLSSFTTFCQETWLIKYDSDGTEMLTDTNDYSFKRVFSKVSNSTSSFVGYTNENVKLEVGSQKNGMLNGQYKSFFSNGNINYEGEYKNDKPVGIWLENFNNGNKKSEYRIMGELENDYSKNIISAWDSLGSPLIINGNGRLTEINDGLKVEENYINGLLMGDMLFFDSSNKIVYTETYKDGKFIKGYNHLLKTEYNSVFTLPVYIDGKIEFEKYVYKFMRKEFKEKFGESRKYFPNDGEIEILINISKNGIVENVELVNPSKSIIGNIFLDAIKASSGNWISSYLRGDKVDNSFIQVFDSVGKTSFKKGVDNILDISNKFSKYPSSKSLDGFLRHKISKISSSNKN